MVILGIDPGTATTGYGIIKSKGSAIEMMDCGCIKTEVKTSLCERLNIIYDYTLGLIKKYKPQKMAVEELFFFKNAKTAISVSHSRGVVMLAGVKSGLEIFEYTPLEVKIALTGYGKADKTQIQKMVKVILGLKDIPKPDDASDALAIAVCCGNNLKFNNYR